MRADTAGSMAVDGAAESSTMRSIMSIVHGQAVEAAVGNAVVGSAPDASVAEASVSAKTYLR